MKKEKSNSSIVFTILLYTVIIFPFFSMLLSYITTRYFLNIPILSDAIALSMLFLSLKYSLSYIDKNLEVKDPKKVFDISWKIFGAINLILLSIAISNNFTFYHIIYIFFYYWLKFLIFYEMTRRYFYSLLKDTNMLEYTEIDKKDEIMVYCRGCGKEIHESAEFCPHCGAPQNVSSTKTNSVTLFFVGLGWSIVLWFVSLFMIGFFIGLANPEDGAEIAGKFGEDYGLVLLLVSIIASTILTKLRILPGTGKKA
ncbi:zinc ribbon domain-containing protein [Sulfurimonas microaerophilic]|uniref:zinc ribbon domain-containing protein n=1 Tax=Sulfurimonas microaerophilic TaxID=3058392 RepID=UPI002714BEF4|nr:zinc ribbon domain-containing protein [Sulfurimonas sp. hsl 1-7]